MGKVEICQYHGDAGSSACHLCTLYDGYRRGLVEREERVRELEQFVRLNAACASVGESLLATSAPAGEPSKTHCSECGVSRYGNHIQQPGEHYPRCSKFKAPAGEQEKTSEGDVGREDHSSAPNSTSPPAEAPSRAGVPSGKAGCRACDPLNPGDVGEPHTCSPHSPGTLYERMAREFITNAHGVITDASLAALLARVADERQREIGRRVKIRANTIPITSAPDTTFNLICDIADWIASNEWRTHSRN